MLKPALSALLTLTVAAAVTHATSPRPAAAAAEFVGSTPCDEPVRRFFGITNAACAQITWELALAGDAGASRPFALRVRYHMPIPSSPNHLDDGIELQLSGVWTSMQ